MGETRVHDMIVVGGGTGGYTAALYAARAGLDTLVLEKLSAGGQMALTEEIDNYPGYEDGIDGFTLAEKMQRQAERFGAQTAYAQVERMGGPLPPGAEDQRGGPFCRTGNPCHRSQSQGAGPAGEEVQAGVWPTVPPATGCATRAKRSPWWAAEIPPPATPCF